MTRHILIAAVCTLAASGGAQEATMTNQTSAELKKLEFLVGNFTGDEKAFTEVGEVPFTADIQSVWDLGGRYVRQEHKSKLMGEDWPGLLLLTFDADIKKYRAWWFDNGASKPMEMTGAFEGDTLVMLSKPYALSGAPPLEYRVQFKPKSATEIDVRLDSRKDKEYTPVIQATYTRKKPGS